jgi:hypothetical protein
VAGVRRMLLVVAVANFRPAIITTAPAPTLPSLPALRRAESFPPAQVSARSLSQPCEITSTRLAHMTFRPPERTLRQDIAVTDVLAKIVWVPVDHGKSCRLDATRPAVLIVT